MKTFLTLAAAGALLAVAGCGKAASDGPVKREAGSWKTNIKVVKLEVKGMPPEMKNGMTQMIEAAGGVETCLTQAQVDKEDLASELSKGPGNGGQCTWSKKDVSGGKIDVAGTCTANGQTVEMAMAGTVASKKTDVTITTKNDGPMGGEVVLQMVSTHSGPCTAGAAPAVKS